MLNLPESETKYFITCQDTDGHLWGFFSNGFTHSVAHSFCLLEADTADHITMPIREASKTFAFLEAQSAAFWDYPLEDFQEKGTRLTLNRKTLTANQVTKTYSQVTLVEKTK
jgi:hypothetical protein